VWVKASRMLLSYSVPLTVKTVCVSITPTGPTSTSLFWFPRLLSPRTLLSLLLAQRSCFGLTVSSKTPPYLNTFAS